MPQLRTTWACRYAQFEAHLVVRIQKFGGSDSSSLSFLRRDISPDRGKPSIFPTREFRSHGFLSREAGVRAPSPRCLPPQI